MLGENEGIGVIGLTGGGVLLGPNVGTRVCFGVGTNVGKSELGSTVGESVVKNGSVVGESDGVAVVGGAVGICVGGGLGCAVGKDVVGCDVEGNGVARLGAAVGRNVGCNDGTVVGGSLGAIDGERVGAEVGGTVAGGPTHMIAPHVRARYRL